MNGTVVAALDLVGMAWFGGVILMLPRSLRSRGLCLVLVVWDDSVFEKLLFRVER